VQLQVRVLRTDRLLEVKVRGPRCAVGRKVCSRGRKVCSTIREKLSSMACSKERAKRQKD